MQRLARRLIGGALLAAWGVVASSQTLTQTLPSSLPPVLENVLTAADAPRGAPIADATNAAVGRVVSVDGDMVTIATARSKVRIPLNAFRKTGAGLTLGISAAMIDLAASGRRTTASAAAAATFDSPVATNTEPASLDASARITSAAIPK